MLYRTPYLVTIPPHFRHETPENGFPITENDHLPPWEEPLPSQARWYHQLHCTCWAGDRHNWSKLGRECWTWFQDLRINQVSLHSISHCRRRVDLRSLGITSVSSASTWAGASRVAVTSCMDPTVWSFRIRHFEKTDELWLWGSACIWWRESCSLLNGLRITYRYPTLGCYPRWSEFDSILRMYLYCYFHCPSRGWHASRVDTHDSHCCKIATVLAKLTTKWIFHWMNTRSKYMIQWSKL